MQEISSNFQLLRNLEAARPLLFLLQAECQSGAAVASVAAVGAQNDVRGDWRGKSAQAAKGRIAAFAVGTCDREGPGSLKLEREGSC